MPTLAITYDRTGVSDRTAAMLASAVLQDFGIITPGDQSLVVNRSKVRRERAKMRSDLADANGSNHMITGLYFDGRKDKTLVNEKIEGKFHRKTVAEEHYSLIGEPGGIYIGHVSVQSSKAAKVVSKIVECLPEKTCDMTSLKAVGCDGTAISPFAMPKPIHFV